MNVDVPATNASVNGKVVVAGWAIDTGAPSGTGVDVIHVWAWPLGGSPVFAGAASYGISRPDVGTAFGSTRFTGSGFSLEATLPVGTYDLAVHARSTVSGTFNNVQVVRVTVLPPVSIPRMWLDYPTSGVTLSQNIFVAGWAVDLGATSGTGVDTVHVWAYPESGAPVFVGAATLGGSRPDVGAAFGSSQFNASGFSFQGTLPPGRYNLVVFPRSTVTGLWNNSFLVSVLVQ